MTMKIVVCVVYPRYPDNTEPLGGFVESEETARKIDDWWRAQPGDMIGTWEDFEVEVESRDQILYGVFSGTPAHKIDEPDYYDPICHGVYTDRKVAEHAAKPETMWEANNCPPKFVLPFRLGWKFDRYFPDGKPWPPDRS
ncbi:hypothetical protein F6I42_09990 [Corynebacterium amycolatum]|uniref:hypothetical protein n=1 Tax=Corynebacterium TaxID=1716 RepID=UPI0008A1CDF3|nr:MULTISPECIES: hypothetical protein [Corynebacterium]KAA9224036.1 hypothetical protein F6I42_09990 [Corynebacterium amycolatum]OFL71814.1 hypothetical protein HMPREF2751_02465 [Corynebacterium sp. HMSC063G05]OFM51099.1 hypothetical protein HMPREF2681_04820 [Corynebacterium sp. HMSC064H12]OFQ02758.1 hypothetical protein HMPREF2960_10540 [Corynebacterium sp. HMSC070B05]OFR60413.1 hypothetical protein HMPREF2878_00245 [Corynebacterium sp. HMSC065H09]